MEQGPFDRAVGELAAAGARPEDVLKRAGRWRREYDRPLSAQVLARNWGRLAATPPAGEDLAAPAPKPAGRVPPDALT